MLYGKRRRDLLEAALLFLIALFLNVGGQSVRTRDALSEKLIRLHTLANSDTAADQALKLKVRDRILREAASLTESARSRDEAIALLRERLPALADAASETVQASGYAYPVTLELREDDFPTRDYGAFALPAGRYLALRVIIGRGAGRNWWCVMFPPLCGAASLEVSDGSGVIATSGGVGATSEAYFTADEISLMTRKNGAYALKFRVMEYWEAARKIWRK